MAKKSNKENNVRIIPNARKKLLLMIISIIVMVFSVLQVVYLIKYTFGFDISSDKMAVYNWVVKLVTYNGM